MNRRNFITGLIAAPVAIPFAGRLPEGAPVLTPPISEPPIQEQPGILIQRISPTHGIALEPATFPGGMINAGDVVGIPLPTSPERIARIAFNAIGRLSPEMLA